MIRKRYLLVCLLLLCSTNMLAQVAAWAGGADYNNYSSGFYFSYISSDYVIFKKANWSDPYFDASSGKYLTDNLTSITATVSQGFGVGFSGRYRLADNLEIRTSPALSFADRSIAYTYKTPSQNVNKTVNAALGEIPLTIKIESDRLGDFRAYLIGGVKYSVSFTGAQKEDPNQSPLEKQFDNARSYVSYEAGVGCDIYLTYFKLSPEIKISNSFKNILIPGTNPYNRPLDQLLLHTLVFSIYFE